MCFTHLGSFISVTIFLVFFNSYRLNSCVNAFSEDLKTPIEIEDLFHSSSITKHDKKSLIKDISKTGNFAEGGSVSSKGMIVNSSVTPEWMSTNQKDKNSFSYKTIFANKNISLENISSSDQVHKIEDKNKNDTSVNLHQDIQVQHPLKKLSETGNNLFLGVPEVVHINGTSSIKPRKGVYYNKIVPRKGVDTDNEEGSSYLNANSCFQLNKNECYSALKLHNIQCYCCNESNDSSKIIKEQPLVNCSNCNPVNIQQNNGSNCQNICCKNDKLDKETYLVADEDSHDKNLIGTDVVKQNKSEYLKTNVIKASPPDSVKLEKMKIIVNSTRMFKSKPLLTKVPHDVEAVNEYFTRRNGVIYVPVIISVFLLPLICVLIFFLWRRTKDFWDKRYYRKVDFLIDGMYND